MGDLRKEKLFARNRIGRNGGFGVMDTIVVGKSGIAHKARLIALRDQITLLDRAGS